MLTPQNCQLKYGLPSDKNKFLVLWNVPVELVKGKIPKRIYCNKDMVKPLTNAFKLIIERNLVDTIKSWDGCYCLRKMRNGQQYSLHSWAVAIDINASTNQLNNDDGDISLDLVKCFKESGFDWGGDFKNKDMMHFQLK
jgi:hypothetical protein